MADYTTVVIDTNTTAIATSDTAASWTSAGASIAFGGTGNGANEFRFATSGGAVGTASAAWPNIIIPGANTAVAQLWAFTADTTGTQVNAYDGTNAHHMMMRYNFDALGSPASAMQMSAFQGLGTTTPVAGTQTAGDTTGANIINGQATDTSSTSFLKINVFGSGFPAAGAQETPSTSTSGAGTTPTATTGTAGSVTSTAANWLNAAGAWQSAQGWIQYITAASTVKVLQAFFWYFTCLMFVGPHIQTGIMVFSPFVIQYTWT